METAVCKAHSSLPTSFYDSVNPVANWKNDTKIKLITISIEIEKIEELNTQDDFLNLRFAKYCLLLHPVNVANSQ